MSEEKTETKENSEMSFLDHLEEMRGVILRSMAVFILAFVSVLIGFHYFNSLMMFPLNSAKKLLAIYTGNTEQTIEAKTDKIGPVYLVKDSKDGNDIKEGPYWILPKEDGGKITLTADGVSQNNAWYSDIKLRSMTFATPIIVYFYVGFLGALCFSLPAIFYFAAKFIAPGLKEEELKLMRPAMIAAVVLFSIGAAFAFSFILPAGIAFMSWMAQGMNMEMFPDAQSYYSMVIFVTLAIGITFELPLVVVILIYLGILNPEWLKKNRRLVFVILLVFASIVTPPDIITQCSLTIPLYLMYEMALRIGIAMRKRKLAREAEEERLAEIEDAKERKEYAQMVAKERLAEEKEELIDDPAINEIDTSHYEIEDKYGTRDTSYYDDPAYDYGSNDDEDYGYNAYIDYGKLSRPVPEFSPNWDLNKKDYSFMSPNWQLNDKVADVNKTTEEESSKESEENNPN